MPTDPLDSLRLPDIPAPPRPAFAAELRARIQAALRTDPTDPTAQRRPAMTDMTDLAAEPDTTAAQVVTPYLCVHDAGAALAFYAEAFGAFEQMRVTGDDGRIGHCEFTIGGAHFMMSDEWPEAGVLSPRSLGGGAVALYLNVVDVDYSHDQAVAAGAQSLRPPEDQPHGHRHATVVDPFGHRWMLSQPIEAVSTEEYARRETGFTVTAPTVVVEPGYITMHTPDAARAALFFGELFGWAVEHGPAGEGYGHIHNTKFPMGFAPPSGPAGEAAGEAVTVYFRVDDIDRYAAKVTELGGRVLSRAEYPSGGNAECVDDQGMRFDLFQPAPGY